MCVPGWRIASRISEAGVRHAVPSRRRRSRLFPFDSKVSSRAYHVVRMIA